MGDNDSEKVHDREAPADAPGPVKTIQLIDNYVGIGELALLCFFLVIMITSGVWETYAFFAKTNEAKPAELIKFSVFFSALLGAALAAQRGQMISMDIISRMLKPKTRAWLRVVTTVFTVVMCMYLVKKGWEIYDVKSVEVSKKSAEKYYYFNQAHGAFAVCFAGVMLAFHFTLHAIVDVIYLSSGRVPPEDTEVKVH